MGDRPLKRKGFRWIGTHTYYSVEPPRPGTVMWQAGGVPPTGKGAGLFPSTDTVTAVSRIQTRKGKIPALTNRSRSSHSWLERMNFVRNARQGDRMTVYNWSERVRSWVDGYVSKVDVYRFSCADRVPQCRYSYPARTERERKKRKPLCRFEPATCPESPKSATCGGQCILLREERAVYRLPPLANNQPGARIARTTGDCRSNQYCKLSGRCGVVNGKCAPTTDEHCRSSRNCRAYGTCSFANGKCQPTTEAHCLESLHCRSREKCYLTRMSDRPGLRCDPPSKVTEAALSCRTFERGKEGLRWRCLERGECTRVAGRCQATSEADCRASTECKSSGRCSVNKGRCAVLSDADCRGSAVCRKYGKCSLKQGKCAVVSVEDCRRSEVCGANGPCTTKKHILDLVCVPPPRPSASPR
jgi:hypothetical protein